MKLYLLTVLAILTHLFQTQDIIQRRGDNLHDSYINFDDSEVFEKSLVGHLGVYLTS